MRSKDVLIPHVAIPLTFLAGGAGGMDMNEQDTLDDVYDCVQAIIRCPEGYRPELPGFGIADQTFTENTIDLELIADKVRTWEPRSDVIYEQTLTGFGLLEDLVKARVSKLTMTTGVPSA